MRCPICGEELKSEAYGNMPPIGVKTYHSCVYCPNGDFGTDYYAQATKLEAELRSAGVVFPKQATQKVRI